MPDPEMHTLLRVVRIQVFQGGQDDDGAILDKIIQNVKERYENTIETGEGLEFSMGKIPCQLRMEKIDDFIVIRLTNRYDRDYELRRVIDNELKNADLSSSLLPSNPLSAFTIFAHTNEGEYPADALVEEYSSLLSRPEFGVGVVRGCLLSIFEPGSGEDELFRRYYLLLPLHLQGGNAEKRVGGVLEDIKHLAVHTAELSALYGRCKTFFSVLESGEREISEKTEDFLWKLMGPEPAELEKLESWLGYIMERDSTISAMISTMRTNYIEARSIVSRVEGRLKRMNETSFMDYPRNTETELDAYNRVVKPFENTVVRSEGLKTRLGTVMEEVRTYLSIQQQKATIEEQKASKEQLVRLVGLQEIFHKVEIFIVAVYMTEMARTVFEVLFHEEANLLTALFIPVALVLAVGVSRLLHKE